MSQFVAPVIAGFIADGQGWQWVLYWCAIFAGASLVICFFLLEETNFARKALTGHVSSRNPRPEPIHSTLPAEKSLAGAAESQPDSATSSTHSRDIEGTQPVRGATRSIAGRLRLFQPGAFSKPNKLMGMALRPIRLLSFPVIFYAGFAYGSALGEFRQCYSMLPRLTTQFGSTCSTGRQL